MSVTLKVSTERTCSLFTYTWQFPVIEVQVLSEIYLISVAEISVVEIHGACHIILYHMSRLSRNRRIEMGIEHISHGLGLLHGNLQRVTL